MSDTKLGTWNNKSMTKGLIITFILAGLLLAACASGQPQINLETTHFDFGDVVNGDILSRDIVVSNKGTTLNKIQFKKRYYNDLWMSNDS
jgi:hypothetical protein